MFGKGCYVTRLCLLLVFLLVATSADPSPRPSFVETPDSITVDAGQNVVLPCAVRNLGSKQVIWRSSGSPNPISVGGVIFVGDDKFEVLNHEEGEISEFNLRISDVQTDYSGSYECLMSTRDYPVRKVVHLTVNDLPPQPSFVETPDRITVDAGQNVVLPCAVRNLGTKQVIWRSNGSPNPISVGGVIFVGDDKFEVLNHEEGEISEFNLRISDVQTDYSGSYECLISTRDYPVRKVVHLTVNDD